MHVRYRYAESAQYMLVIITIINNGLHGCWSLTYRLSVLTPPCYTLLCEARPDSTNYILQSIFSSGFLLGFANREVGYKERGEDLLLPFASFQCWFSTNWAALLPPRSEFHLQRDPFPEILASDNPNLTHLFSQARGGNFLLLFAPCYLLFPSCSSVLPHQ